VWLLAADVRDALLGRPPSIGRLFMEVLC
jgi:hypothetical protein